MDSKGVKSRVSIMATKSMLATRSAPTFGQKSLSRVNIRKPSFGFSGVAGIRTAEKKSSQVGLELRRPALVYLNTYQLNSHQPFNVTVVTAAIENLLEELFTGHIYNVVESSSLALRLADVLTRKVKAMNFNRYRVISLVTIVQKRAQSYNNAVAFIWDHERDNYVNVQKEEPTAFVQVTVFGIYMD